VSARSYFYVLHTRTYFRRYRGPRLPFSCFALPHSFLAVLRASTPVFMFYTPGLILGDFRSDMSCFHVLLSRTHFRRYRERRVPFLCFTLPDSFSAAPRALGPVFIVCSRTHFRRHHGHQVPFSLFAPELIFGGTTGIRSHFHVLPSRTHFRRYRGRQVPFSCFALQRSFSAVLRALAPVLGFALPESLHAIPRASAIVFMFCAPGLIFYVMGCDGSSFHLWYSRNHFRRYKEGRLPFSYFALQVLYSVVPRLSGPCFHIFSPGLVFDSTISVGSRFLILPSRTRIRRYRG